MRVKPERIGRKKFRSKKFRKYNIQSQDDKVYTWVKCPVFNENPGLP